MDLLLSRLRCGEPAAFEELVRTHAGRLLATTRRILRSEDEARDAVQDAFLEAFEHIGDFHGEARISTWLHRIAVNAALMRLRSRRRRREESIEALLPRFYPDGHRIDPGPPWALDPGDEIDRARQRQRVRACIDQLPERHRTVLLLRDVEGLSTRETAQALGISPDAVKMRLHRAHQALRTLLAPHFRPGPGDPTRAGRQPRRVRAASTATTSSSGTSGGGAPSPSARASRASASVAR